MKKQIDIVLKAHNKVNAGVQAAQNRISGMRSKVQGMIKTFKKFGPAIAGGALAAMRVMQKTVQASLSAYKTQMQSEAKLQAVLKSTGYAANLSSKELRKFAAELQETEGVGDELIISMMGILATFKNIGGSEFKSTTKAVLDMGAAMGKAGKGSADIESAVIQLGKALNDPVANLGALGRVGIQFDDTQTKLIKNFAETNQLAKAQAIILKELESEFGGAAEAMNKASMGSNELKNNFGDLLEVLGGIYKKGLQVERVNKGLASAAKDLKEALQPIDIDRMKSDAAEQIAMQEAKAEKAKRDEIAKTAKADKQANKERLSSIMNRIKATIEAGKDRYSEFANNINRMAKKSNEFWQNRKEKAEETKDKISDLENELANEQKKLAETNQRNILNNIKDRVAAAEELNRKTVQGIINEAKEKKDKIDFRRREDERADKLKAKEARGIKISKRDAQWLDAWQKRADQAANIPGWQVNVKEAEEQLKTIQNNGRTLTSIKTEIENHNKKLNQLLGMG